MLRKLLKHEFRATARIMLPLFGLLVLASVGANLSIRGMLDSDSTFLSTLGTILIMLFTVAIVAVGIMAFILMINRFYKNLLQDEGYVMMTLPVSIHQQIWQADRLHRVVRRHGPCYHPGLLHHGLRHPLHGRTVAGDEEHRPRRDPV